MYSVVTIFLVLGSLALHANGASLGMPGKKLPLAKRTHRIPRTLQEPSFYKRQVDHVSPLEKKDTLEIRQETCGAGTVCPTGGCCDGPCCGDGCCPAGYACQFVGTTPGCCPTGTTCSDQISGCTDAGYVECSGYDFCCPAGQACSLDANNNAQCNGVSIGNGNVNTPPPAVGSSSNPAAPPVSSPITTPVAGGSTSINFGGVATTTPFYTLPTTTANASPTTTTRSVNNGNTGGAPLSNSASGRFGCGRMRVGVVIVTLLGGVMAL